MRPWIAGIVLGLACATAPASFTGAFDGLQSDLTAASAALTGQTDPVAVKQKKAVDRSVAAVVAYSTSLGKDLSTALKVSRLLEKAFPAEDPLLGTFDGVLDDLETGIGEVRSLLADETELLLGAKRAAAEKALASVDGSLALAGISSTRTDRTALLKKAEHAATAARKALRRGAKSGFQGPLNGSFEEPGVAVNSAAYWTVTLSGGTVLSSVNPHSTYGPIADGIYDLDMGLDNGFGANIISARQDGVLLSRSHRLLFDYDLNLLIYSCGQGSPLNAGADASVKLEVLFILEDPSTTVVLFSRELSEIPRTGLYTIDAVAGQAVDLPYLPSRGTLVFRVTGDILDCGTIITGSKGHVRIDHIRVE
jgi:hypothetical protein